MNNYKGRVKGSVNVLDNTEVQQYLREYDLDIYNWSSFKEFCPRWLDDVLEGAGGQATGTRTPSAYQIFMKLVRLPEISTVTVKAMMPQYGVSYIKQWTNILKCASQAVIYHKVGKAPLNKVLAKPVRAMDLNIPVPPTQPIKYWFMGKYYEEAEYEELINGDSVATVEYMGETINAKDLHEKLKLIIR